MSPALSFDERLIAYTSKQTENWNVYTFNCTLGKTTQMIFNVKEEMAPTFMPDKRIELNA